MRFDLGTDGRGFQHLIVPAGGFRTPASPQSLDRADASQGGRSQHDLAMNGPEVFAFTLKAVPKLVRNAMESQNWSMDDVDSIVMHQANTFMLNHLGRQLKVPADKLVIAMQDFGNTSSASIPLALSSQKRNLLEQQQQMILAGFGVGFSWASAAVNWGPMVLPEVVRVSENGVHSS